MINELIKILSPPQDRNFDETLLTAFEAKESLMLPEDFKEIISVYGGGLVDDFICILDPTSSNGSLNFEKSKYFQDAYTSMQQEFPSDYPRPRHPAKNSFLPWAVTNNGETFVWIIDGDVNAWKTAIHSVDQGDEELYSCGCLELLLKILLREIKSAILPSQFPSIDSSYHHFEPAT
ncbi:SMI1/KNR4 family protein [Pseudomonas syringae]|uniref:SMI1/KNR4 family protein n=3 Tax=Pseudomonas syringae TaxID=317 RepID=A0A9Q4A998_PSESX|nr:SMI1/KNR4 family protein [Pseudomonas syringae]KTB79733.1 hypothetical protein AO070_20475 [Pseudomonas syringae pv. syringae PD2766]MCF5469832.1 hypothetical protein [Pseudomonas syringae]MCF5475345.1 hypothetical protein [Pseudomonas syringae]MCF5485810.1 hypothetical protein [Pseudomonas syringae]MCF5490516.1 hypothetical protein [Pseudomonas syringae]